MQARNSGLTAAYNLLRDPAHSEDDLLKLRRVLEKMDRAVLDAYGWSDIEVPPYCPTTPAEEKALEAFQDEVIDRLFVLNAKRAEEERVLGLGTKKGKQARKAHGKKQRPDSGEGPEPQTSLDFE